SRRRRRHRAGLPRIHGLVPLPVSHLIFPRYIGRQGHVPHALNTLEEVGRRTELYPAFSEASPADDFGDQFLTEKQLFSQPNLSPRAHQALPLIGLLRQLFGKQDLHLPAQEIARGWVLRAQWLCPRTASMPVEAGGKHSGVIED